jgi:site-specific DNA recombinase
VALIADPGVSGATRPAEREGFGKLIGLAASGEFSILLVWKFDRLARQIVFAVTAVSELSEQHNVAIRSVTEPIDTATPMGRTIFAVLAGMAEQEREAITERTWHGRREKGTRGGYSCGGVPYGYDVVEGKLVVNASEAAIVRRIFAMRARLDLSGDRRRCSTPAATRPGATSHGAAAASRTSSTTRSMRGASSISSAASAPSSTC